MPSGVFSRPQVRRVQALMQDRKLSWNRNPFCVMHEALPDPGQACLDVLLSYWVQKKICLGL